MFFLHGLLALPWKLNGAKALAGREIEDRGVHYARKAQDTPLAGPTFFNPEATHPAFVIAFGLDRFLIRSTRRHLQFEVYE